MLTDIKHVGWREGRRQAGRQGGRERDMEEAGREGGREGGCEFVCGTTRQRPPPHGPHRLGFGWGQGTPPPYFWVEKLKKGFGVQLDTSRAGQGQKVAKNRVFLPSGIIPKIASKS